MTPFAKVGKKWISLLAERRTPDPAGDRFKLRSKASKIAKENDFLDLPLPFRPPTASFATFA
jgi:hypothetical protein